MPRLQTFCHRRSSDSDTVYGPMAYRHGCCFTRRYATKKLDKAIALPRRGLYTIDEIKHMSRMREEDMEIVGIDPGKCDLIYAMADDYLTNPAHRFRYCASQRRTDRCSTFYGTCMQKEKPKIVLQAESNLSKMNSRSSHLD
eukprot:364514-Prymnesium_polylepis.1